MIYCPKEANPPSLKRQWWSSPDPFCVALLGIHMPASRTLSSAMMSSHVQHPSLHGTMSGGGHSGNGDGDNSRGGSNVRGHIARAGWCDDGVCGDKARVHAVNNVGTDATAGLLCGLLAFGWCCRQNRGRVRASPGLQLLKKPSQCFAILERLTWHKSNKLSNILKIIYVIV
jgi:hypothetical protein